MGTSGHQENLKEFQYACKCSGAIIFNEVELIQDAREVNNALDTRKAIFEFISGSSLERDFKFVSVVPLEKDILRSKGALVFSFLMNYDGVTLYLAFFKNVPKNQWTLKSFKLSNMIQFGKSRSLTGNQIAEAFGKAVKNVEEDGE